MSKNLYSIKGQEAVKAFMRFGWLVWEVKATMLILRCQWYDCYNSGDKVLKIGLLKNAIKKSGMSKAKFLELL